MVVLAAGYAMSGDAQADAKAIAAALAPSVASVSWFALDSRTKTADAIAAINGATGIVVTGRDSSLVLGQLQASPSWTAARDRWAAHGVALLADDAAAAAAGTVFVAEAPAKDVEAAAIADALHVTLSDGLGLVHGLAVTPRLLPDQRWPQLFQLARARGRRCGGRRPRRRDGDPHCGWIGVRDRRQRGRGHRRPAGDVDDRHNGAIGGAWLVVDTFADGDAVAP